ncbi:putative bifunctional diguanylate cyclase/phosphodiesterase [Geodermatophilus dictyosporus]|uniref:putative bifunctional diguanylate cyclase/phosphodiesterase n=1 Tax=Geodermatophilus dictyosporus TaxID=1523247 RepID=UPI0010AA74C2|nr:EAL domain-containing protein [Geodermatophilus dictyosporus]
MNATLDSSVPGPGTGAADAGGPGRGPGFRLTARVFWDLAVYMVGLGLAVGLVFPPFATALGVPGAYAERVWFRAACLIAGFLVGALSYAICRWVVGGRLAVLSGHLRQVAEAVAQASRTGDWSASSSARIPADSDDQLGETARAFNSLLDALEVGQHFRSLIRNASDVITIVDTAGRITYQTPSVGWVLGYPPGGLVGTEMAALIHPEDAGHFAAQLAESSAGLPATAPIGCRMRHRNGSWRWTETVVNDLRHDPAVSGVVLSTRDVSDRRELEEQLRTQAFYDPLTDLPNRSLFLERLRAAEEALEVHGIPLALLYLDMDDLKAVNDDVGHEGGDRLLQVVSTRILDCLRPADVFARLEGDEFAVLLTGPASEREALRTAERILAALVQPVLVDDGFVQPAASLGVATSTAAASSGIGILRAADVALSIAKATGKGRCETFQPRHHAVQLERERLQADLQHALDGDQLVVHYQPLVDLGSGRIDGYEALLRWQHPERGLVSPADFIPLAETSGLIVPVGRWVLREATAQAATWQHPADPTGVHVSVNVSVRQFAHGDLLHDVADALRRSGLPPHLLTLEITESLFASDIRDVTLKLERLKDLGVRLALDDFGTGYSSLSYLRRFPFDILKIDKSFVEDIDANRQNQAVASAIVTLGQTLELDLVAEGIETPGELRSLEALGVHLGQGFHLGRPGPAALVCPTPGIRRVERRDPDSVGAPLRGRGDAGPTPMTARPPVPPRGRHAADG